MNTKQMNRIGMFRAVLALLQRMEAGGPPALQAVIAVLATHLETIVSLAAAQLLPTSGSTEVRRKIVNDVTELTITLATRAESYAKAKGQPELLAKVQLKPHKLRKARVERRMHWARQVHAALGPVVGAMADYSVTPGMLAEFETTIAAAALALTDPRAPIIERKLSTAQLAAEFETVNELLREQVDPLVTSLRESDPESYACYREKRRIIDLRATRSPDEDDAETTTGSAAAQPATVKASLAP